METPGTGFDPDFAYSQIKNNQRENWNFYTQVDFK